MTDTWCIENDFAAQRELAAMEEARSFREIEKLSAQLAASEQRVKELEEALLDISWQMTTKELASACVCDPDIEFGYDEIIRVAHKALEGK